MNVHGRRDTYIIGYFNDPQEAGAATHHLVERGFSHERISVLSSIPYPGEAFATHHRPSPIPLFSALGAIFGLLNGLALGAGTALLYPLVTGGKPIVSWPTVGIIVYELTMLGAVVVTALAFLFFARLPRRSPRFYDPRVSEGGVVVAVPCRNEHRVAVAEEVLREAGADEVTRKDGV